METQVPNVEQFYYDYLKEEGYRPIKYDDGDISFKHEGNNYIINIDNDDPAFFRISSIYGLKCDNKTKAYKIASETTKLKKMVKTIIIEEDNEIVIIIAIECILNMWLDFKINLDRWLKAMDSAIYYFVKNMIEEENHEF